MGVVMGWGEVYRNARKLCRLASLLGEHNQPRSACNAKRVRR